MDKLTLLLLGTVFLFAVSLAGMIYLVLNESQFNQRRALKRRLLYMSAGGKLGHEKLALYKKEALRGAGLLERVAFSLPRISSLDRMLLKGGLPLNASTFILVSVALASISYLAGYQFLPHPSAALGLAFLVLFLPFLLLRRAERQSLAKFQEQLPEALDFMSRALRSGHALSGGFEMVAKEMEDPIKAEFAAMVDEVNLGLSFKEAMENLCTRVPLRDLRFFAIAVQIQRTTGGNIAEIFDNISYLIHERTKFQRQVRTLTADGRLSAWILFLLPVALFAYIYFVNNEYISLLWTEQVGRYISLSALASMIFGALVMKKIVRVEM